MQCACTILSSVACLATTVFFHIISYSKNVTEDKVCVLIFSTNFVWNISHCKEWVRYDQKCILVSMYSTWWSYQILMELELSRLIFRIILKYKISWKYVPWEPNYSMWTGQMDRQTWRSLFSCFLQFCKHSYVCELVQSKYKE